MLLYAVEELAYCSINYSIVNSTRKIAQLKSLTEGCVNLEILKIFIQEEGF
jgi:hypothetical protein